MRFFFSRKCIKFLQNMSSYSALPLGAKSASAFLESIVEASEYLPPLSYAILHVCNHIEREYDRGKGCYLAL